MLKYPVVAIGGIKLNKAKAILKAGAESIAVVTAVTHAENPELEIKYWLNLIHDHQKDKYLLQQ